MINKTNIKQSSQCILTFLICIPEIRDLSISFLPPLRGGQ